jgi:glyceraldehyde-3-phosphate dehydrogenase/erythrose-4-phosphate dehydrogenase
MSVDRHPYTSNERLANAASKGIVWNVSIDAKAVQAVVPFLGKKTDGWRGLSGFG